MVQHLTILGFVCLVIIGSIHAQYGDSPIIRQRQLLNKYMRGHIINSRSTNCPEGMCLSQWGYCGTTDDYCGEGCQGGSCRGGGNPQPPPTGSGDRQGQGTYYDPGLGACGINSNAGELVAAMAAPDFDPQTPNGNPNNNNFCGRSILVNGPRGSVTVRVVDRCPVCQSGDLDLSPAAFNQIGDPNQGRIPINWRFV